MISLTTAQLDAWIAAFAYPLVRILGFIAAAPLWNAAGIPKRVRLFLGLAITLAIAPALPPMPTVAPGSLNGLWILAQQMLIGIAMGFSARIVLSSLEMAGELIGLQMGLGFATFYDPANGVSVPVLGQFMLMLVTLLFLAINGHLVALEILAESFVTLPYGQGFMVNHYWTLAGKLSWVIGAGLLLTLPAVTALLVINLAFGVMTRAAPQLNIFSIGFPLTLALGLVIFTVVGLGFMIWWMIPEMPPLQQLGEFALVR